MYPRGTGFCLARLGRELLTRVDRRIVLFRNYPPFLSLCPRLLEYMGSSSNGVNPMNIISHIDTKPVEVRSLLDPMTPHIIDPAGFNITFDYCHVSYNGSTPCSCQDCAKACGTPPDPIVEPEPCLIMGKVTLFRYIQPMQQ